MWADTETEIDFLNYTEIAELITELISRPDLLPLSLGVFGGWGVGKSSTLRLVERGLASSENYVVVRFDAWLYQGFDDARSALMSVIAGDLLTAAPPTLKEKAKSLFSRVDKLRALGLLVEGGAATFGVPTFGLAAKGVRSLGDVFSGTADEEDVKSIEKAAADAKDKVAGLLTKGAPHDPPNEIAAFRREFGEVLSGLDKKLVVFIDNLDRCLPENAIHTLEAVRLFLFMPNTAFVIAADEDMIRHAVAYHFKNPGERHVTDYLDKLIQIPVRVPRLGVQEIRAYLFLLLAGVEIKDSTLREKLRSYLVAQLQVTWREDQGFAVSDVLRVIDRAQDEPLRLALEMADRMAPMLARASLVQGNPRIVKRLMNVVQMRASIAKKRGMPLDETIIAKLALFERCTDTTATEVLHDAINNATSGKPDLIKFIESAETLDQFREALPEPLTKHLSFLMDWGQLAPKLTGIDLRPAVYLARETVPLRFATSSLPPKLVRVVETLLRTATISSRAASDAIASLEADEPIAVMEQLIGEMRKNSAWEKVRSDFRGSLLLARHSNNAAKLLGRFLRSLPRQPAWMLSVLKDDAWHRE
jgi:predicted KAP-like P-loop ATPase